MEAPFDSKQSNFRFDERAWLYESIESAFRLLGEETDSLRSIAHFLAPSELRNAKRAKRAKKRIVVSALYCESNAASRFTIIKDGSVVLNDCGIQLLKIAELIFVPSIGAKRFLRNQGIEGYIAVIPPFVDTDRYERIDELLSEVFYRYMGMTTKTKYILGYLDASPKNLKLTKELSLKFPDRRILLMTTNITPMRRDRITRKVGGSVTLIGRLPKDVLISAFLHADAYISITTPYPEFVFPYEAFAAKTQIFSIGEKIFPSAVVSEKTGYRCENIEQLSQKLRQFLKGELPPTIDEAYNLAKANNFTAGATAMLHAYLNLLKGASK